MQLNATLRRFVAGLLICLLPLPLGAQGPSGTKPVRVRITGPDTYEVPGVIKIARDRIQGRPAKITDGSVQFARPNDGQLVTILRPGQRLTGKALAIADGLLDLVPDRETEQLHLPLQAITKIEVSEVAHSRLISSAGGVAGGILTFLFSGYVILSECGDSEECFELASIVSIGGGAFVGGMTGHMLRGGRWRTVSAQELGILLDSSRNSKNTVGVNWPSTEW